MTDACVLDGLVHPPAPQWPCYRTNANPQEPPVTAKDFPPHEAVMVPKFPTCDICTYVEKREPARPAQYDCATHMGSWANICAAHYHAYAKGLGLGRGQRMILIREGVES